MQNLKLEVFRCSNDRISNIDHEMLGLMGVAEQPAAVFSAI